jgi:hypothetical protein
MVHKAEFWALMPEETTVTFCPIMVPNARFKQMVIPAGTTVGFCNHMSTVNRWLLEADHLHAVLFADLMFSEGLIAHPQA